MLNLSTHVQITPLAKAIADQFAALPQVVAVALSGSRTTGASTESSDYDIYVYIQDDIPVELREAIALNFAQHPEINNQFWEPGDEWIDLNSGCGVDIMYRSPQWMEAQIEGILVHHQASVGYSTCFWWNILTSAILYDKEEWLKRLQAKATQPYPEALKTAIVAKNYPILRQTLSSYTHQIELALSRNDAVSVLHRTTALLASYFDIIFAVNHVPHPGEKRLVEWVSKLCTKVPEGMAEHIKLVMDAMSSDTRKLHLLPHLNTLMDELDKMLIAEGLLPL